jgi:hypothetical protein
MSSMNTQNIITFVIDIFFGLLYNIPDFNKYLCVILVGIFTLNEEWLHPNYLLQVLSAVFRFGKNFII